jgi:hypothetical protein
VVSARWNGGTAYRQNRGQILILGHFCIILNLEVGRRFISLSISCGLWDRGGSGWTRVYTCVNSNLKDVQIKWGSLGSEVVGKRGASKVL